MNWLLILVVGIVAFNIYDGIRRGFIRKAVSMASFIVTIALVTWITPLITGFLVDNTSIYGNLQEKCAEIFGNADSGEYGKSEQVLAIEGMELPESIKELLLENNNHEVYDMLNVADFYDYIGAYLARMIINTMAYLVAFVIVWTLLKAALLALDVVAKLPVLHGINKLAGAGLGAVQGISCVWIGFLLVTVFSSGALGQKIFQLIGESQLLSFLYENNMIMHLVYSIIF